MPKTPITSPFKAMEEEAYHAFREWPIFLLLRQKELETHLAAVAPPDATRDTAQPAHAGQRPAASEMRGDRR